MIGINWLKPMLYLVVLLPLFVFLAVADDTHSPLWVPLALVPIACVARRYYIAVKRQQYSALRIGKVVMLVQIGPYRLSEVMPSGTAKSASYLIFSRGAFCGKDTIRALRFLDDVYVEVGWE